MKRFIDIFLFTMLFFLIFSYFWGGQQSQQLTGLRFWALQNTYKVPAGVTVQVANYTPETLSFHSCDDISLRFGGDKIDLPKNLCEDVTLKNGEVKNIDLSEHYNIFSQAGQYTFEFSSADKKLISQTEIKFRGALGQIFTGLFYAPIYNLLAFLIQVFNNSLGTAILAITIIVRIILLFPQHKMMVSQRKMQAIQPKIKKLQEKHKWNQQVLGMELMKLYKEQGVNPMGSCGFLLIQMPILLVLYNILINITSLRNEFYLYAPMKDFHISQIDFNFFGLDLLAAGGVAGLCLALFVAVIQYIQVKLSLAHNINTKEKKEGVVLEKKKDEKDYSSMMPDPEMMNKFMLYGMPVMVGFFTFTLAAGVGLYWWMSTLFAIFQQLFVNKIVKK